VVRIVEHEDFRPVPEEPVPDQGLSVDTEERGSVYCIALRGELDVSTAPRFNAALADPRVRRCRALVIDLSELTFMDSTGLSAVLVGEMHARTSGQRFTIVQGPRHVQELFRLTGVDHFLEVVESAALPPE
jgi:anti-sigma B factor antagonist